MKEKNIKKVSIIVPVYNTDPFLLKKCINSILDQTYGNIEVIIINDGSTKKATLSALADIRVSERVSIINTRNMGVSHARNIGINEASGDFLTYIDSDDYINRDYISEMIKTAQKQNVKIVFANIVRVNKNNTKEYGLCCERGVLSQNIELFLGQDWLFTNQGTLYATNLANKEYFDERQTYAEDTDYSIRVLRDNPFAVSKKSKYYYIQNESSALHNNDKVRIQAYVDGCYQMIDTASAVYSNSSDRILSLKIDKLFRACEKLMNEKIERKEFAGFIYKNRVEVKFLVILRSSTKNAVKAIFLKRYMSSVLFYILLIKKKIKGSAYAG